MCMFVCVYLGLQENNIVMLPSWKLVYMKVFLHLVGQQYELPDRPAQHVRNRYNGNHTNDAAGTWLDPENPASSHCMAMSCHVLEGRPCPI